MSIVNPSCPTGCSDVINPVAFDPCDPKISIGEINRIYVMAEGGAPLTTWLTAGLAAELLSRIDNASASVDAIRELVVMADMPAATGDVIDISDNRKFFLPKTFTINVSVDDVNAVNHEFLRQLECNTHVRVWYANPDFIWGDNDGVAAVMQLNDVVERGNKGLYTFQGTIQWDAKFTPRRDDNPFAT